MITVLAGVFGVCWGSFLNVIAYRGIAHTSVRGRSRCPHCGHVLSSLHLIPVVSWLLLNGSCAFCAFPVSLWYPCIEIITAVWCMSIVYLQHPASWPIALMFGSAMIVTIRTDGEHFLILTAVTRYSAAIALTAAYLGYSPIPIWHSLAGGIIGYSILAITQWVFVRLRGYEGLGWGDVELLGAIGTFVGPYGVWLTLLLGSIVGTLYGIGISLYTRNYAHNQIKLPFGLFLAAAGMVAFIKGHWIMDQLLGYAI